MTDEQQDVLNDISIADMCTVISSREQASKDETRRLRKENAELKEIVTRLITQPLDDTSVFYEGLSKLYTSGLSKKQIALVEQFI